jgi:hypothetical protein
MKKNLLVAIIFGIVSIPWTYFFGVFNLVLWPSFIASASFFAAGAGLKGFYKSYVNNLLGIIYAVLTILIAQMFGNSLFWLSFYVGVFMFIASLHYIFKVLSFMPATFFGYATLFSVNAANKTLFAVGLEGQFIAAAVSMFIGALIAIFVDTLGNALSGG